MITGSVLTAKLCFIAIKQLTQAEHATLTKLCSDTGIQPHRWLVAVANNRTESISDIHSAGAAVAVTIGSDAHELLSGHPYKKTSGYAEYDVEGKFWKLSTIHPSEIIKQPERGIIAFAAIRKALRYVYGDIPLNNTPFLETSPRAERAIDYLTFLSKNPTLPVSIDFETLTNGTPSFIGITHKEDWAMSIKLVRSEGQSLFCLEDECRIWDLIASICSGGRIVIAHNWLFDAQVMRHWLGINPLVDTNYHDTMLMFGACWPDLEKSLAFCGSFYLDVPAWKHLSGVDMGIYNALDACRTLALWYKLRNEVITIAPHAYALDRLHLREAVNRSLQSVDGIYYTHTPFPSSHSDSYNWRTTDHPFLRPIKRRGNKGPYVTDAQFLKSCLNIADSNIGWMAFSADNALTDKTLVSDEAAIALYCNSGPRALMPLLGLSQTQCVEFKRSIMATNPRIVEWHQCIQQGFQLNGGKVINAAGRERRFTGRQDDTFWRNIYRWWLETSAIDSNVDAIKLEAIIKERQV